MEAFVPCHLAIRHSLIMVERGKKGGKGGRLQFKAGESLKTEGAREGGGGVSAETSNDDAWEREWIVACSSCSITAPSLTLRLCLPRSGDSSVTPRPCRDPHTYVGDHF